MLPDTYDLVLIAYYLQRDLFAKVKTAVRPGGVVVAIVHTPDRGERWSAKRAWPGDLRGFFADSLMTGKFSGITKDHRVIQHIVGLLPRSWRGEICLTPGVSTAFL